jgi:hypothetical protein
MHLERHEIASGENRAVAEWVPEAWLQLCDEFVKGCHRKLQGITPVSIPLALKRLYDRENYCLETVNRLRRSRPRVTEEEVAAVLALLESGKTLEECIQGAKP